MQDRLKGSCSLPVVGNTSGGSPRLSVMSEEHGAKPESTKVLPPQWRDSTEKQNRSNRSGGKAIYLFLAVFTLFISYLTHSQARNHQMSFQRAPAETQKKAAALWSFCLYVFPQHLFHSLWMHNFYTAPFLLRESPFWRLSYLHEPLHGPEHFPFSWGSCKQGFFIFKTLPTNLSFSFLFIFLGGGWCTQYWAIITRGGWKLLQLEKWAQDMIPPHRMPGRCHWNSLSLSATRVEPIWTPSKVLKTPLFIITVKWWDIVYPDRKINSHLQNACLTVLNVIWFLFKCKMKLGSQ